MKYRIFLLPCIFLIFFLVLFPSIIYGAGWTNSGLTSVARYRFAAEKLSSGKVYVTGGEGQSPSPTHFGVVEEYNPSSNTWTTKAPMLQRRYMHTASMVTLSDSTERVLAIGGRGGPSGYPGDYLKSAELYNPSSNTWMFTSTDMASYHANHTVTKFDDGKVLVTGGHGNFGVRTAAVDLYDPINNTWLAKNAMSQAKVYHTATLLTDGRVFVVGGQIESGSPGIHVATTEFYDPSTNVWNAGPSLNIARQTHQAVLLSDGRVMVVGGTGNGGSALSSAEIWSPATNSWTMAAPMAQARFNHIATLLQDGRILVTGGSPGFSSSVEIYNPSTDEWETTSSLTTGRGLHTATLLNNGNVLVANGLTSSGPTNTSEVYFPDPIITPTPTATPTPTPGLNVPLLKQGVLPYSNNDPSWEGEAYDHSTTGCETIALCGCFTTSIAMTFQYHGISKLPDGTLLDPGTLNTWLTNNNGYLRDGGVVPSVAATLAKKAKAQNPEFAFDGIEYSRFIGNLDQSKDQLRTDIQNGNPGILHIINSSVPTHFIVATGIDSATFSINDPARNISSLALSPYNDAFDSLRRFIPSNTDLSYITLAVDPDLDVVLKDASGVVVGNSYFEYPLQDPALPPASTSSEPSLKILEFPKPITDNYKIEVTSPNTQAYQLDAYLITQEGDTKMETFSGQIVPGITNIFDLSYDKETIENINTQPLITLFTLRSDLQTLYEQGLIDNQGVYKSLKLKVNLAIAASYVHPVNFSKKLTVLALKTFLYELNYQRGRHIAEEAYQVLKHEANYLITKLQEN